MSITRWITTNTNQERCHGIFARISPESGRRWRNDVPFGGKKLNAILAAILPELPFSHRSTPLKDQAQRSRPNGAKLSPLSGVSTIGTSEVAHNQALT